MSSDQMRALLPEMHFWIDAAAADDPQRFIRAAGREVPAEALAEVREALADYLRESDANLLAEAEAYIARLTSAPAPPTATEETPAQRKRRLQIQVLADAGRPLTGREWEGAVHQLHGARAATGLAAYGACSLRDRYGLVTSSLTGPRCPHNLRPVNVYAVSLKGRALLEAHDDTP